LPYQARELQHSLLSRGVILAGKHLPGDPAHFFHADSAPGGKPLRSGRKFPLHSLGSR
jgi:hypothetical protein